MVSRLVVKIGKKTIGRENPTFIIVEIASAHGGDVDECKKLVKMASETGADAIKFQKFICDELATPEYPGYEDLKKIELSDEEWKEVINYTKKFNLEILADVFDKNSCDLMDQLGVAAFKIHSSDLTNPDLIKYVAKKQKPILLGTGGATLNEIRDAIAILNPLVNKNVILVHGFQSYPTKVSDTNLRLIQTLKNTFQLETGYHDHVDAENELALILPCVAVAMGASVIEKHITLDRKMKGYDYHSALNPSEFRKMIKLIRETEAGLGSGKFELSLAEKKYRKSVRKKIVARIDIQKGKRITRSMLAFKRSNQGLAPTEINAILGKKAKVNLRKNEIITLDKVL